jgi:hypothetical protein
MPQDSDSRELVPHVPAAVPAKKQQGAKQEREFPRVPPEVEGVQANFCRNVNCENFGVPPAAKVARGRPKGGEQVSDGYQLDAGKKLKGKKVVCTKCGQRFSIKSNLAIVEELHRLSAYLAEDPKAGPSCPHEGCANHGVSIANNGRYQRYGRTEAGSQRWLCNACGKKFSEPERDRRDQLVAASTAELEAHKLRVGRPEMTDWRAAVELIEIELTKMLQVTPRDRWIRHPNGTGGEPMKAVCWLTDREGVSVSVRQTAIVFARASLHTVDRYFMLLRRKVSALERPIQTASNEGRVWHGYAPYNPELLQKLLDIYRCFYNFVHIPRKSLDKRTPAMRLGLARGPVRVSDILYFRADGE